MADLEIGSRTGWAIPSTGSTLIAAVTADAANGFDVAEADIKKFKIGMKIDLLHRTTGASLAANRTVTVVDDANNRVTYDGADVAATTDHGAYPAGIGITAGKANQQTGTSARAGYINRDLESVQSMRDRLTAIDSTFYTAARLNSMTHNDMAYAIRVNDAPATIKQ